MNIFCPQQNNRAECPPYFTNVRKSNFLRNFVYKNTLEASPSKDVFIRSSVNFGSTANGKFLRELSGIHDPYSGVIILTPRELTKAIQELNQKRTLKSKLKYLEEYKDNMLSVEYGMFHLFKDEVKRHNYESFAEILQNQRPYALRNLTHTQNKILNEMESVTPQLQEEDANQINNIIKDAKMRISLDNYIAESSQAIKDTADIKLDTMLNIIREALPNPAKGTNKNINKAVQDTREQIASILEPSERFKRKTFINKIADIQINSILKQVMKKIETLPEDLKQVALKEYMKVSEQVSGQSYEANINGKTPVEVVKQLQAKFIPESKGKKDALDVIVKIAKKLPTSKDNMSAYIVKYSDRSDREIGERLLTPSRASIEHIFPDSLGGDDEAANFMLTTTSMNSERGNMPIPEFHKRYPDIPRHSQAYFDDIINAGNKGKLKGHEWYPYLFRDTWKQESGIDLKLSRYKIPPETAFKTLPPRLREKYPKYLKYIPDATEPLNLRNK